METSQETNNLNALPFYNLNEREFTSLFNSSTKCLDHNSDLYNLLPNPDKADQNDPDQMFINVRSEYYSVDKVNKVIENSGSKTFSIFHCNARSLPRNLTLLDDMIYTLSSKPDVLAVTETKLNEKTVSNVDISGYNFYHVDSLTAAGGAGIYINRNLKTINRQDIKLSMELVESCWVEIKSAQGGRARIQL